MPDISGSPLVAGLPMYDWPEVRWATDAFWAAVVARLRDAGIAAPLALDRDRPAESLWTDPGLIFGQTCGWPYVRTLRSRVRLVATPRYRAAGCEGARYRSVILVRRKERAPDLNAMAGRLAAVNDRMSLSGYVALLAADDRGGGKRDRYGEIVSGSHRESMRMVAEGTADLCAADAVCWALAQRHDPALIGRLRVLAQTPRMPALPFICATGLPWAVAVIRDALASALADPSTAAAREALLLQGVQVLDDRDYDAVDALAPDLGADVTNARDARSAAASRELPESGALVTHRLVTGD